MKGSLNFYFPCKLKDLRPLKILDRKWNKLRLAQTREIKKNGRALTDLIFFKDYRSLNESVLVEFQKTLPGEKLNDSPFAAYDIARAYQELYNDYIFSKNTSVVLSTFKIRYTEGFGYNRIRDLNAKLLLNINAENRVACFIVCANFKDFSVDSCIYLKHLFYKHCIVEIIEEKSDESIKETLVDYVSSKNIFKTSDLDDQIDFRCRYSYLEIDRIPWHPFSKDKKKEIYGLVKADEGYDCYPGNPENKEYVQLPTVRQSCQIYNSRYDVLLVQSGDDKGFPFNYETAESNIDLNNKYEKDDFLIAGVNRYGEFPHYLKAVETHYLVNNETTNEIEPKERSYINPIIFCKRAYRIWKILYQVDTNKYYISKNYLDNFGTTNLLRELRDEYNNLLGHIVGFIALVLAFITLIFTIVSVCK